MRGGVQSTVPLCRVLEDSERMHPQDGNPWKTEPSEDVLCQKDSRISARGTRHYPSNCNLWYDGRTTCFVAKGQIEYCSKHHTCTRNCGSPKCKQYVTGTAPSGYHHNNSAHQPKPKNKNVLPPGAHCLMKWRRGSNPFGGARWRACQKGYICKEARNGVFTTCVKHCPQTGYSTKLCYCTSDEKSMYATGRGYYCTMKNSSI